MMLFPEAEKYPIMYPCEHTLTRSLNKQDNGFTSHLFLTTYTRLTGAEFSAFVTPLYEHFPVDEFQRLIHRVTPL